jgi:MFS family permease
MSSDQLTKETKPDTHATRAFGDRDFIKLWTGESISLIGTQVTQFTMPLVAVLTLNVPVYQIGILNALRFVPWIVMSLPAGVWMDRHRRRPVLIACALANAVLIGLIPIAKASGFLSIDLLYVVVTFAGLGSMAFDIAALSYVPDLVSSERLADANSKIQSSTAFAGIVGPGLAGMLVGLITAPITLSVDAVSYLFSAGGMISIRKPEPAPEVSEDRPSIRASMIEGLRAVWGNKYLNALLTQGTALNLFFGIYITVWVVYAVRVVRISPFELGIVLAAVAAGILVGAMLAGRARKALGLGKAMAVATIASSVCLLPILIPRHASLAAMVIFVACHFGYGWGIGVFNVNSITLRQVVTPRRLLARMNSAYRMVLYGIAPIGMSLGGVLGGVLGLRTTLAIGLWTMAIPLLWLFFSPAFRLTEMPEPVKDGDQP